jgi:tRNA pseudouridine55 synthase
MTDGVIILDKPIGMTSARAVSAVKRLAGRDTKVGHAGTLDPLASGVLVLLLGRATRDCEKIMSWQKTYEATVKLGATTATDDAESPEQPFLAAAGAPCAPEIGQIEQALRTFVGTIPQRPPLYSAVKLRGTRACDRARHGQRDIQLARRLVTIYAIRLLSYDWPLLRLSIDCGRGTYIRSLGRDLGVALNVGGYLTALRRTRVGEYTLERAVAPETLNAGNLWSCVLPAPP